MPRRFNYIYSKLVSGETDIVGHIAYALYKAEKVAFIERYKQDNEGRNPTEKEIEAFHNTTGLDGSIERYKARAFQILNSYSDKTLKAATKQIEEDYIAEKNKHLEKIVEPLKPKSKTHQFWFGVGQSVVGAFIFAVIIAALAFVITYSPEDSSVKAGKDAAKAIQATVTHDSIAIINK